MAKYNCSHMAKNAYVDATTVIPAFCGNDQINATVNSVLNQIRNDRAYEILIIGCRLEGDALVKAVSLEERNQNVRLVLDDCDSLCGAMRRGIREARGRYTIFMQPGDRLGENALEALVSFFDAHSEEVDAVVCRYEYETPSKACTQGKSEYNWLQDSGIYATREYPHVALQTTNICVKTQSDIWDDLPADDVYAQEQLLVAAAVAKRDKFGYCADAVISRLENAPSQNVFDGIEIGTDKAILQTMEGMIKLGEEYPSSKGYCDNLVLRDFTRAMNSGMFFHDDEESEDEEMIARVQNVLKAIPASTIAKCPYISGYARAYLFARFRLIPWPPTVQYGKKRAVVEIGGEDKWRTSPPIIRFTRCIERPSYMHFKGYIGSPAFILTEGAFEFSVELSQGAVKGRVVEIPLRDSAFDYQKTKIKISKCFGFEFDVPASDIAKELVIHFNLIIDGQKAQKIQVKMSPARHNAHIIEDDTLLQYPHFELNVVDEKEIRLRRTDSLFDRAKNRFHLFKGDREVFNARNDIEKAKKPFAGKRVWLYADLPSSLQRGNSFVQICHDIGQNDGIARFYVTDDPDALMQIAPELEGHLVKKGSREHVGMALSAEVVFASYLESFTYLPYDLHEYGQFGDLANHQTFVYMQHGVLHARLPWYLSYDRIAFDKIVVSAGFEIENLKNRYGYPEESLIPAGMPRFDEIAANAEHERKIIYVPSWRNYLVSTKDGARLGKDDEIRQSSFYLGIMDFVSRLQETGVLEKYDFRLDIKLHPNFKCYEYLFNFEHPRIKLIDSDARPETYAVAITDFSSYIYDFLYAGCEALAFVPDYEECASGMNHYFDIDGVGAELLADKHTDAESLVDSLERILRGERKAASMHAISPESTFLHMDGKNCDRLYHSIIEMLENNKD